MLPFSREQFFDVFAAYNDAVWPLQIAAYVLGLAAIALEFRPGCHGSRIVSAILACIWLWTGIAYHGLFFAPINPAAYGFALLFVAQGLLFLVLGVFANRLQFAFNATSAAWIGLLFALYAAVIYPLIGLWSGHAYPNLPMFGITPCPVTIFTFGLLLMAKPGFSRWLLVIPFVWSLIGGSAAILLGVPQDWLLMASGFIAIPMIVLAGRQNNLIGYIA